MATGLRIVHCFRSPVGGIFRHVRDLVRAQAAAGHQVGIICDSSTGGELEDRYFDEISDLLALGVTKMPIHRHIGPGDLVAGWRTYRAIKELRPDVLHGHGAKGGALARLFGSLLRVSRYRVARLYSPHGGVLHYDPKSLKGRVLFGLERLLGTMTDHVLFVSDYERRTFFEKVGRPKASSLVYNGLNEPEFAPVTLATDAADFLYIGMMRDLKGPDIFIDALSTASNSPSNASNSPSNAPTAVMVGDGDDLPRYKDQVALLGLSDRVRFHPSMPIREGLALGRIIVVPSRAEAMPYTVLEALAAGKTMIASAVGGIPEIFPAGSPALVKPTVEDVANAMVTALSDETAFAAHMPPVTDLEARFGSNVMAAGVEAAYRAALARQR